jgi:hypothetical protein
LFKAYRALFWNGWSSFPKKTLYAAQLDSILGEVRQLVSLAKEAALKAGQEPDVGELEKVLTDVENIRNNEVETMKTSIDQYLAVLKMVGTVVGAVLLVVAALSVVSSILLVRCCCACLPSKL